MWYILVSISWYLDMNNILLIKWKDLWLKFMNPSSQKHLLILGSLGSCIYFQKRSDFTSVYDLETEHDIYQTKRFLWNICDRCCMSAGDAYLPGRFRTPTCSNCWDHFPQLCHDFLDSKSPCCFFKFTLLVFHIIWIKFTWSFVRIKLNWRVTFI